jgi:hypothetical protein
LNHRNTACCIAGDAAWRLYDECHDIPAENMYEVDIWASYLFPDEDLHIWALAQEHYGLSDAEADLIFGDKSTYQLHLLMADLIESGRCLGSNLNIEHIWSDSYSDPMVGVSFNFRGEDPETLPLEELIEVFTQTSVAIQ